MKLVDQTTFGEKEGNCFSACVATILEMPIDDVPFFMIPEGWWEFLLDWLKSLGYYALNFQLEEFEDEYREAFMEQLGPGLGIMGGKSPRGDFDHAVVSNGYGMVHDPHPSRDGILTQDGVVVLIKGISP